MSEFDIDEAVDRKKDQLVARGTIAAAGTLFVMLIGLAGWIGNEVMATREFRSTMKQNEQYIFTRLADLESGRTSRMAIETRTELDALWRELGFRRPAKDAKE